MAYEQIPNLPLTTHLNGTEQLEIVQSGASYRTTTGAILSFLQIQGGPGVTTIRFDAAMGFTPTSNASGPVFVTGTLNPTNGGTGIAAATFSAAMATWFATLPTTLPGTSGQPWNNGGMLSFS